MRILKPLRFCCAIILAVGFFAEQFGVAAVYAKKLGSEKIDFLNDNRIYFYQPDDCKDAKRCVAPTGDQVTWIGDSYSVMAKDKIEAALPGVDLGEEKPGDLVAPNAYIQGGKHTEQDAPEGSGGKSGLKILKEIVDSGKLRPFLVFALGTNDPVTATQTQSYMKEVAELAGDDTNIIITTAAAPNQYNSDYEKDNVAKKDFADSHSNVYLADWAAVSKDEYFSSIDKTHPALGEGFQVWVDTIVGAIPQNCTGDGVLLPGTNINEKVWNWLVNYLSGQNLSNVDMSALVSGILGNFQVETGVSPLMYSSGFYGMFMLYGKYGGDVYVSRVNSALGGNYFKFYGWWDPDNINQHKADDDYKKAGLSDDQIDTAIDLNLKYMTEDDSYWNSYLKAVKEWKVADTPQGYSDLFVVVMERAYETSSVSGTPIEDAVVSQYASKEFGTTRFQGAAARRKAAEAFYNEYSGSTSVNPTVTTGASAITGATQAAAVGTNKNYAGDTVWGEQELGLVEDHKSVYQSAAQQYGVPWQAIATVHRLESSLSLTNPNNGQGLYQLYSYTGGGSNSNAFSPGSTVDEAEFQRQTNIATEYMKKIIESGGFAVDSDEGIKYLFFQYNGSADRYKKKALAMGFSQEEANIGEGSPYVMNRYDARRDPKSSEMDSNWPGAYITDNKYTEGATVDWFGAYVFYTALGGGSGNGGDFCRTESTGNKLADYVLKFAWPEFKGWNFLDPMPDYKTAVDRRRKEGKYTGSWKTYGDCGGFVTTLMQESGFDTNYNLANGDTHGQEKYVADSPNWELVNSDYGTAIKDESELHPGDVAFSSCSGGVGSCGHTYVYVGEIPGFSSNIASASWDKRVPMAVTHEKIVSEGVHWYHKVK